MKLPAYLKYKASGVEWLGDVPEHWDVWKHAHLFQSSMGQTILREHVSESGLLPVLSATEEYEVFGYLDDADVILNPGDLVIPARGNSIGHVKLVRERCTTTQTTIYSKPLTSKVSSKFSLYFLLGNRKTLFHFDRTAIPQLTVGQVSSNPILLPPLSEQQTIATFLDWETGRIDRLVAKKQELIERLKEKRTALISRTVTRGLPPAAARAAGLPENPTLKPSGVEWLGDVPEHWDVWKHAHLFQSSMGQTILREHVSESGLLPVLSATEEYEVFGYLDDADVILNPGDLVIPARGNSIGHVKLVRERCTTTQTTIYSKPLTSKVSSKFSLYFLLGNRKTLFHFDRTAIPQLTVGQVSSNPILLPPLSEQQAIAAYLDAETAKLDALVAKVETAIERLQEYRTALITAAVTGKIDVRKQTGNVENQKREA